MNKEIKTVTILCIRIQIRRQSYVTNTQRYNTAHREEKKKMVCDTLFFADIDDGQMVDKENEAHLYFDLIIFFFYKMLSFYLFRLCSASHFGINRFLLTSVGSKSLGVRSQRIFSMHF